MKAGAERDVGTPFRRSSNDWRQKNWQFGGAIAVVAIQEHDNVRGVCRGQAREACPPVAAARFLDYAGSHSCGDSGVPSVELLSTTITSVTRSDGRSARTRGID